MEDAEMIQLYWDRNDQAIRETELKYGRYCASIARNILDSREDAEECVNDTYLRAWNAMPIHWPEHLAAFLGKITRNLALSRRQRQRAEKRGGGEVTLILEELADCVSGRDDVEQAVDLRALEAALNAFVAALPEAKRRAFTRRYWYADPVGRIAGELGTSPGNVSKMLERTRKQLRLYLTERGFSI